MTPVISGTEGDQTVGQGNAINPFSHMTVSDANGFTTDTVTISLLNNDGQATDDNGKLVLNGTEDNVTFEQLSAGVYALVDHSEPQVPSSQAPINDALPKLAFIAYNSSTTTLAVHLSNTFPGHTADDSNTTINADDSNAGFKADMLAVNDSSGNAMDFSTDNTSSNDQNSSGSSDQDDSASTGSSFASSSANENWHHGWWHTAANA